MKKLLVLLMTAALAGLICGCSGGKSKAGGDGTGIATVQPGSFEGNIEQGGGLSILSAPDSACSTSNGYYYLVGDTTQLRDGSYGTHLMYMDYASCREIYLCSTAGCKHDSPDCPAVFLYDDFPLYTTKLFIYQNRLYVLSREYDNDGTVSTGTITIDGSGEAESQPAVLYRANLDGTQREKVYTFDADLTLEDIVMGDADGLYVITKKLSADTEDGQSYTTSSERKLMFLDVETAELKEIRSMMFDGNISWQVIGCSGNSLILGGLDFGRELSREEEWDDDAYKALYENSSYVYALLDLKEGNPKELCRQSNQYEHSVRLIGDILYLSSTENQDIESLNIITGERKTIGSLPKNLIMGTIGEDTLCCCDWNLAEDFTYYFVNIQTGEVRHSTLVNKCNGWELEFRAETERDVLVIYDYDATKNSDDSYEIHQYKYALISKEDLFAGKENYRKIEMVGPGQ